MNVYLSILAALVVIPTCFSETWTANCNNLQFKFDRTNKIALLNFNTTNGPVMQMAKGSIGFDDGVTLRAALDGNSLGYNGLSLTEIELNPSKKAVNIQYRDPTNGTVSYATFCSTTVIGAPTRSPTKRPSRRPTRQPSKRKPTSKPSRRPTRSPTKRPSRRPTRQPSKRKPSAKPSKRITFKPSARRTKTPTVRPSKRPTRQPIAKPTSKPSSKPTPQPFAKPSVKPSVRRTMKPSSKPSTRPSMKLTSSPSSRASVSPTTKSSLNSVWGPNINKFTSWPGSIQFGQTHVINAIGEKRYAPKLIAEREAELLFTPSLTAQPTPAPTLAPTAAIVYQWGLEQLNNSSLTVIPLNSTSWPSGYPKNAKILLVDTTEYYVSNTIPNVDVDFDLGSNFTIQGVYVQTWYVTAISSIQVGVRGTTSDSWRWFAMNVGTNCCYNSELVTVIPKISSRYVKFRIMGGSSSYGSSWGLRRIKIGGANNTTSTSSPGSPPSPLGNSSSLSYIPGSNSNVKIVAKAANGTLLGTMILRSPDKIRPSLEQSLMSTTMPPYSSSAWSASLPWNWIRENTELLIGTVDPNDSTNLFMYRLVLKGLVQFSEHTLTRTKVLIFGDDTDVQKLDTYTSGAYDLATGMYNAMPLASLHWVDSVDWHVPYLVTPTLVGPRLVRNEAERRSVINATGQDPGTEPGWDILKNQFALRHNLAHTGRGLTITNEGGDSSPYSSGTSIFMGWGLTQQLNGNWYWDYLGYWDGWSAAAWTGWVGMVPGDECGNTLIHELGHSQTMYHFTTGSAASWGIADQYPDDGVNEPWSPWGWHATTRRFRTWYRHENVTQGKHDPMNGGEDPNSESCFPQHTAYGAQKSQNWASQSPILLSGSVSGVSDGDGAYLFDSFSGKYKKIANADISTKVDASALPPVEVGIPTYTFIGTLGADVSACQTYPPIMASSGNTFIFPDPLNATLGSYFINAKYMVEVAYNDSTVDRGLIAVADLYNTTSIAYYSFTVAMKRNPKSVRLYQYSSPYPNITATTGRTLLHERLVVSSSDIPSTSHVGRGWLGNSSDVVIKSLCFTASSCASSPIKYLWRGADGYKYTLSTNYTQVATVGTTTVFTLKARRAQDGLLYDVKVSASRFLQEGGATFPLLSAVASNSSIPADASHGLLFTAPYSLNMNLPSGTYSSDTATVLMKGVGSDTTASSTMRLSVSFEILSPTDSVDISPGKTYASKMINSTVPSDSSVYFLATDRAIGPTQRIWWGTWGGYTNLSVPLYSSCLGGFVNGSSVTALIKAQQYSCGSRWEMNAGRGADSCGHSLELTLGSASVNPWRSTTAAGCVLSTHPMSPVVIEARRWHDPLATLLLNTFILNIKLNIIS